MLLTCPLARAVIIGSTYKYVSKFKSKAWSFLVGRRAFSSRPGSRLLASINHRVDAYKAGLSLINSCGIIKTMYATSDHRFDSEQIVCINEFVFLYTSFVCCTYLLHRLIFPTETIFILLFLCLIILNLNYISKILV